MATALVSYQGSPLAAESSLEPETLNATLALDAGTNTSASAPLLTSLGFSGTAAQLSDVSRDYTVYLCVTTSGTATTVEFGHTSAASDVVLVNNASVTAGQVITFRLPAGYYVKASGTSTVFSQSAVGC
jgi:hypothetical protein